MVEEAEEIARLEREAIENERLRIEAEERLERKKLEKIKADRTILISIICAIVVLITIAICCFLCWRRLTLSKAA